MHMYILNTYVPMHLTRTVIGQVLDPQIAVAAAGAALTECMTELLDAP